MVPETWLPTTTVVTACKVPVEETTWRTFPLLTGTVRKGGSFGVERMRQYPKPAAPTDKSTPAIRSGFFSFMDRHAIAETPLPRNRSGHVESCADTKDRW